MHQPSLTKETATRRSRDHFYTIRLFLNGIFFFFFLSMIHWFSPGFFFLHLLLRDLLLLFTHLFTQYCLLMINWFSHDFYTWFLKYYYMIIFLHDYFHALFFFYTLIYIYIYFFDMWFLSLFFTHDCFCCNFSVRAPARQTCTLCLAFARNVHLIIRHKYELCYVYTRLTLKLMKQASDLRFLGTWCIESYTGQKFERAC